MRYSRAADTSSRQVHASNPAYVTFAGMAMQQDGRCLNVPCVQPASRSTAELWMTSIVERVMITAQATTPTVSSLQQPFWHVLSAGKSRAKAALSHSRTPGVEREPGWYLVWPIG